MVRAVVVSCRGQMSTALVVFSFVCCWFRLLQNSQIDVVEVVVVDVVLVLLPLPTLFTQLAVYVGVAAWSHE